MRRQAMWMRESHAMRTGTICHHPLCHPSCILVYLVQMMLTTNVVTVATPAASMATGIMAVVTTNTMVNTMVITMDTTMVIMVAIINNNLCVPLATHPVCTFLNVHKRNNLLPHHHLGLQLHHRHHRHHTHITISHHRRDITHWERLSLAFCGSALCCVAFVVVIVVVIVNMQLQPNARTRSVVCSLQWLALWWCFSCSVSGQPC